MGKHYKYEFKLKVVQEYLNCSLDYRALTKKIEKFFGLLKQEMYYGESFDYFYQLEQSIQNYMIFYNNERIKSKLKGLSPKNFRKQTFEILY